MPGRDYDWWKGQLMEAFQQEAGKKARAAAAAADADAKRQAMLLQMWGDATKLATTEAGKRAQRLNPVTNQFERDPVAFKEQLDVLAPMFYNQLSGGAPLPRNQASEAQKLEAQRQLPVTPGTAQAALGRPPTTRQQERMAQDVEARAAGPRPRATRPRGETWYNRFIRAGLSAPQIGMGPAPMRGAPPGGVPDVRPDQPMTLEDEEQEKLLEGWIE